MTIADIQRGPQRKYLVRRNTDSWIVVTEPLRFFAVVQPFKGTDAVVVGARR